MRIEIKWNKKVFFYLDDLFDVCRHHAAGWTISRINNDAETSWLSVATHLKKKRINWYVRI